MEPIGSATSSGETSVEWNLVVLSPAPRVTLRRTDFIEDVRMSEDSEWLSVKFEGHQKS